MHSTSESEPPTDPAMQPLVWQRADPWVWRHDDGFYYFSASVPAFDAIELRRAPTLQGLGQAPGHVIWHRHETGPMGAHIWAPELHFIGGRWYVYFAAGSVEDPWAIRIYVLENASPNPLEGEWVERGQLKTHLDSFCLDATTFEHRGQRYLAWAQRDPVIVNNSDVYLARMDGPLSIVGEPMMLSRPELPWEQQLFSVNEGPAALVRNGKVFIAYSASGTDANYCMGLLQADEDADLLDPASWTKSPVPVFQTSERHGLFGPGHNSFTTLPDGRTDVLIFHARTYREIVGDPLHDPNRHTFAQVISWNADGTPRFGEPGEGLLHPSGPRAADPPDTPKNPPSESRAAAVMAAGGN